MSKNDVFYRRSFHSDRDLRGVESMLELDQPLFGRKSNASKRVHPNSDAGFEAPRNSLDVSIGGLLDLRRQGQVIRAEDIPIGYELSRSLTSNGSRRRSEDFPTVNPLSRSDDSDHYHLKAKSMAARLHLEPGSQSKPRTSVVARLMGLDPFPSQESGHGSSRLLPQDAFSSQHGPSIAKKQNSFYPSLSVSMEDSSNGDSLSYGELPFRKHPQEKQLEEFKREFASRHAFRSAGSKTTTTMMMKKKKKTKKTSADDAQETLSDVNPEEFLDTLDFLRANQEFFSRVLNDPGSVFAKHLPRRSSSSSSSAAGKDGRAEGGNLMRSFSESRKDYHDLMMLPGPRKPEMGRYDRRDSICAENYDAKNRLPHQIDSNSAANMVDDFDRPVPTRIVVLKPNVGKHATFSRPCSSSSSSPSPHTEGLSIKTRVKDGKENNLLKQMKAKSSSSKNQIRQDAKDIARRIIEQATKEETRPHFLEPMGRRQRAACGDGDGGGGISDGEAPHLSSSSNGKLRRENGKMYSSLPSSPRLHRIEAEDEHNRAMMNSIVRKGPAKGAMAQTPAPVKISKETVRGDGYGVESSAKHRIRKERQKSKDSAELRIDASPSPKVLPRSLSAPTVNRTSSEECAAQQEPTDHRPESKPKPKPKPKPNEISVLKGRLLSLKESFLSSKKNTTKKKDRSPSPLPVLEITTDSVVEQQTNGCEIDGGKEASHGLLLTATSSHWDETSLLLTPDDDDSKESSTDHSINDALSSDNGMTPKGLRRWVSAATDFTDHTPEANADKCEQPSPISVLEVLPYQEESPISDIKHEDLLHLEHFPVYNNNNDSVDDDDDGGGLFVAHSQVSDNSRDEGLPCGWTSATASMCDAMAEWTYIRDILIFGGFTEDGFVMKHAFSPDHGIDPSVFETLEDHYFKMMKKNALPPETGILAVPLHLETRRVLFDAVDEILSVQLKKNPTTCDDVSSWFHRRQPEVNVRFFYTGKRLLEHIWAQLSYYRRFAESEALDEKALEDIASKDLSKECPWVHSDIDVQSVASELERLICGDLIREFVHDYRRRK